MGENRTRIILLTLFFVFAFSMLFLALFENYVQAETSEITSIHKMNVVHTADIMPIINHEIVPNFGIKVQESSPEFDFDSDDSFQKFLHDTRPFNDPDYVPGDLVPIVSDFTANNARAFSLRKEAAIQFADMAWHFRNAFSGDRLWIVSAYRSSGLQGYLLKKGCTLIKCAKIGTSEHQAGLAVDLKVIAKGGKGYSLDVNNPNKYYDWLKHNAHIFGFHNTYQKGVDIDGKIPEGWHWRYVGRELATLLYNTNQTFAEYYFKTVKNE